MQTLKLIFENINVIISIVTGLITVCSLITAGTKTPKPGTKLATCYRVIEALALVVGKAKDK